MRIMNGKDNPNTNYFTCTLGQAALLGQEKLYKNVPEFLDQQALNTPNTPAVGFYSPYEDPESWEHHVLTFHDVQEGTKSVARLIDEASSIPSGETVALLSSSSVDFLLTWLALMCLGHPVLLIAPQSSVSAVVHLCKACEVTTLLYDEPWRNLAEKVSQGIEENHGRGITVLSIPFVVKYINLLDTFKTSTNGISKKEGGKQTDIAYLHHTSGTSSGLPKPIPQTHKGGLVALPCLDGTQEATFTTTPLYHGGIADLFRAWTSNAMIWLFPGKEVPITASNVIRCLDIAAFVYSHSNVPPVKYFSAVPYVLDMLVSDSSGLKHLQRMSMVGVGGAALSRETGDLLVEKSVNLVSRYGSAECGFLMSSDRDFMTDKAWRYLRVPHGVNQLVFEERENGLSELIVKPDWPHMAKRNREDGSYATSDLFEPHPSIPDAWKYHSRADSQLTLMTGKKFDPAPLETEIAASSDLIDDVLIFGEGQPYPGALIFKSSVKGESADDELLAETRETVRRLNEESQSHARIPLHMLLPMPPTKLDKSSKGTILRAAANAKFAKEIELAYEGRTASYKDIPDSRIVSTLTEIISSIVPTGNYDLTEETDLFAYGIDSAASIQIRNQMAQLIPNKASLPLTVVQDYGSISKLRDLIVALRKGEQPEKRPRGEDSIQLMQDMVREYSVLPTQPSTSQQSTRTSNASGKTILLTGPTGTLGAHLLSSLLALTGDETPSHTRISHIYLLVRGATQHATHQRVLKAFSSRSLPVPSNFSSLVTIITCKLSEPNLGLSPSTYEQLTSSVDIIYHLAWAVDFLIPLSSFRPHLRGIENIFHLALSSTHSTPPKVVFCSSTAACALSPTPIPERILTAPSVAGPTGYSQSKWAGEQLCAFFATNSRLRGRVTVVRAGQLSGSTVTGCWSQGEAYPLMLSASKELGQAPNLDEAGRGKGIEVGEECAWTPVDVAASAFVELCFGNNRGEPTPTGSVNAIREEHNEVGATEDVSPEVLHLLPPPRVGQAPGHSTWIDVLRVILKSDPDAFEIVPVEQWLLRLDDLRNDSDKSHPARQLASFWREAYCGSPATQIPSKPEGKNDNTSIPIRNHAEAQETNSSAHSEDEMKQSQDNTDTTTSGFVLTRSLHAMPALSSLGPVHLDEAYVLKMWEWIKGNVANYSAMDS